ncbi:hypothetical protein G6F24_015051 [Rhizopus arrhizus]|nr:hypothetical protein G6F24_015051 [Rhizopus arrhizus]
MADHDRIGGLAEEHRAAAVIGGRQRRARRALAAQCQRPGRHLRRPNTHRNRDGDFQNLIRAVGREDLRRHRPHPSPDPGHTGPAPRRRRQRRRNLVHHPTHAAAASWRRGAVGRGPGPGRPAWPTRSAGPARPRPAGSAADLRRPACRSCRRACADLRADRSIHRHVAERRHRTHHARGPDPARQRRTAPHPAGKVHA